MKSFGELFDLKEAKWKGMPNKVYFVLLAIALLIVYLPDGDGVAGGYLRNNFLISFSVLAIISCFIGEIGDRIPGWNKYIGGGTILVFLLASVLATYGFMPEAFVEQASGFYSGGGVNFLELFIPALIVGSVLTVNRATLIKSVFGYIPLILIGVVGASICGIAVGLIFGKGPSEVVLNYVLPIMGGGTGAGAVPMSEMYASATGNPSSEWFGFAISILTIANIFAILTGALLNGIGEKVQNLSGNGKLIVDSNENSAEEKEEWESLKTNQQDFAAALTFTGILFLFSHFIAEILPFDLHRLAVLVILAIVLNVTKLVPPIVKASAKSMQQFFVKNTLWILMMAVGFTTDFEQIREAFTISNALISLAIVLGATLSIMLLSKLFRFYPIEAAITAGLCMANRGGSGDVAVLGAANRMELISFAQISSRIGGAMMLFLGGLLFNILL